MLKGSSCHFSVSGFWEDPESAKEEEGWLGWLGLGKVMTGPVYQLAWKYLNILTTGEGTGTPDSIPALTTKQSHYIAAFFRLLDCEPLEFRKSSIFFFFFTIYLSPQCLEQRWWSEDKDHVWGCEGSLNCLGILYLDLGADQAREPQVTLSSPTKISIKNQPQNFHIHICK